jgi:hypothetical protein
MRIARRLLLVPAADNVSYAGEVGRVALLLLAAGCAETPAPVDAVYGEVHVHLYDTGTHPSVLFVAQPIPLGEVEGDSVLRRVTLPARSEGPCTLVLPSACPPPCGPSGMLADGGAVHLRGDRGGTLDLTWHATLFSYQPTVIIPRGTVLFGAGETISVTGEGAQARPFSGSIVAVEPLVREAPAALPYPSGAPWRVSWQPAHAERIQIYLVASTGDGRFATITCNVPDEDGAFTIPSSLISSLPAPPRDLLLDVSRDQLAYASAGDNLGVILHSGSSLRIGGHEN